jgi:hypothetical protein
LVGGYRAAGAFQRQRLTGRNLTEEDYIMVIEWHPQIDADFGARLAAAAVLAMHVCRHIHPRCLDLSHRRERLLEDLLAEPLPLILQGDGHDLQMPPLVIDWANDRDPDGPFCKRRYCDEVALAVAKSKRVLDPAEY